MCCGWLLLRGGAQDLFPCSGQASEQFSSNLSTILKYALTFLLVPYVLPFFLDFTRNDSSSLK